MKPDTEFVEKLEEFTKKYEMISGIHDIMVHDYGPGRKIVSFHAEVPANCDICKAHDVIDQMEQDIYDEFNCITTIHMDPIVTDDEEINEMRKRTEEIVKEMISRLNNRLSIIKERQKKYDNEKKKIEDDEKFVNDLIETSNVKKEELDKFEKELDDKEEELARKKKELDKKINDVLPFANAIMKSENEEA